MTYYLIHDYRDPIATYVFFVKKTPNAYVSTSGSKWGSTIDEALRAFNSDTSNLAKVNQAWSNYIVASFDELPAFDQIQSTHPELFI